MVSLSVFTFIWIPAAIPVFGVIRSMLVTSPLIVSTAFESYILLYWPPGPQPPLPRHIIPPLGWANDNPANATKPAIAIADTRLILFICSHLLSSPISYLTNRNRCWSNRYASWQR